MQGYVSMTELQQDLKKILDIQELDMKMLRLMRLKKERKRELDNIHSLRTDLKARIEEREGAVKEHKKDIRAYETRIEELEAQLKKLSSQQAAVKKLEEFNALSQQITTAEREKSHTEQLCSDLTDKLDEELAALEELQKNLSSTEESSKILEGELHESIGKINTEGRELKEKRDALKDGPSAERMRIYERLFGNKQDRVIVPIANRVCSGCHIVLTAQHENMVRRGEKLVTCEHCSRILFWQDSVEQASVDGEKSATTRRRRRKVVS